MTTNDKPSSSKKEMLQTTMGDFLSKGKDDKKKTSLKKKRSILDDDGGFGGKYFTSYRTKDTETYRKGYPGKTDDKRANDNWLFYSNELKSYPDGDYIDNIHKNWKGDYRLLERHHGYIQWIFPIRESGMNFHSQELQLHEMERIKADKQARERVLTSYRMMLDFYGMKLRDVEKGYICRARNWKERFAHLNRSYHNYLRITRMLKSLGELGYEHLKKPFVEFVLQEAIEAETLANTLESCVHYWLETIRDDEDRESIKNYIRKMEEGYGTERPPREVGSDVDDWQMTDDATVDQMLDKSNKNLEEFDEGNSKSSAHAHSYGYDDGSHEAEMLDPTEDELSKQEEHLRSTFAKDNEELQRKDEKEDENKDDKGEAGGQNMEVEESNASEYVESEDNTKNTNLVNLAKV